MKKLKCPICGKGNIQEGGNGYFCDYIKTDEDFCKFQIFKNYSGVEVTAILVEQLIRKGETNDTIEFTNRYGTKFYGYLKISNNNVIINFIKKYSDNNTCKICNRQLLITPEGAFCENKECDYFVFEKELNK